MSLLLLLSRRQLTTWKTGPFDVVAVGQRGSTARVQGRLSFDVVALEKRWSTVRVSSRPAVFVLAPRTSAIRPYRALVTVRPLERLSTVRAKKVKR